MDKLVAINYVLSRVPLQERRRKFLELADRWKRDTLMESSMSRILSHEAYLGIIGQVGKPAIRFMLEDLRQEPNFWFEALQALTGEWPVPAGNEGDIERMSEAWLDWGRRNRYIR